MRFEWDETKRRMNLEKHDLDFEDAWIIFEGRIVERVDVRNDYGETRLVALGCLEDLIVAVVFVERGDVRRLISIRRANRKERELYGQDA